MKANFHLRWLIGFRRRLLRVQRPTSMVIPIALLLLAGTVGIAAKNTQSSAHLTVMLSNPPGNWGKTLVGQSISEIIVSPASGSDSTLLALSWRSGQQELHKSIDGGQAWTLIRTGGWSPAISPAYATDQTIYLLDYTDDYYGIILKSANGGSTWLEVYRFPIQYTIAPSDICISPNYASDGTVFSAWTSGDNTVISRDWGNSWTWRGVLGVNAAVYTIAFSPSYATDHTVFVGAYRNGVKRSTDDGTSWQWARTGMETSSVRVIAVSPAYASDHTLFAGTSTDSTGQNRGLYRSTTSGDSWIRLLDRDIAAIAISPSYASNQTLYVVDRYRRLLISPNGGNSLLDASKLAWWLSVRSVAVTPDSTRLLVATDEGLYWMPAGGVSTGTITAASGGTIAAAPIGTTIAFASGAITDTAAITLTAQLPGYVDDLRGTGHFFDVTAMYEEGGTPVQLAPDATYTVTVTYDDADLGPAIEDTITLYRWSGSAWVQESSSAVDTINNTVIATPNHLGIFGVLGETNTIYLPKVQS